MKDVTNNFLETIEPVYTPGAIKFDFDKFDAAIQAAVSELSDEQLESLEYNDIKKEILLTNLMTSVRESAESTKTRSPSLNLT